MLVSIVTVYYNREAFVEDSINSLLAQTYKNVEILAVDDGSTDSTYDRLCSFSDPRFKIIRHENQGFVKSVRKAIDMSSGEIIAIHGSGDISLPERIEKQAKVLIDNEEIGVVGCYVENIDYNTNNSIIHMPRLSQDGNLTESLKKKNIFTHGEVMFRKALYDEVGGYREYFRYSQDKDLWLRLSLFTKFFIIEEVLYKRYNLGDGVSRSIDKIVMQNYFVSIMNQCIDMRCKGEKDLIDRYGFHASFYRKKDRALAKLFFKHAIFIFIEDNLEKATEVNTLSINENRSLGNVFFALVLKIASRSRVLKVVFNKLFKHLAVKFKNKRGFVINKC